jgi:hypothetical protein
MKRALLVFAALVLVASACASSKGASRTSTDHTLITREQIRQNNFTNAYDAVASLHANWLQKRGADSFLTPGEILVYFDEVRLGGIETLRSVTSSSIMFIRFYDGIAATNRWGVGHSNGVILVSSRTGQ